MGDVQMKKTIEDGRKAISALQDRVESGLEAARGSRSEMFQVIAALSQRVSALQNDLKMLKAELADKPQGKAK